MTRQKSDPKAIPVTVIQADLIQELGSVIRELAREQSALIRETVRTIQQLRELHEYVMRITKSVSRHPCDGEAKIILFPVPPRVN